MNHKKRSDIRYYGSKPREVEKILDNTLKYLRLDKKVEKYSFFPEWENVVGSEIAKVAKPVRIENNNILILMAIDATWIQELSFKKNEIIKKVNSSKTGAYIVDIRFISGNPNSFSNKND